MALPIWGYDNRLLSATLTASAEVTGLGAGNVALPLGSAAEAWQTPLGTTTAWLLAETEKDTTWRAFLLARTNLTTNATVRWRVGPTTALVEEAPSLDISSEQIEAGVSGYGVTRASKAWAFNSSLVLTEYAPFALRRAWDPATREEIGVLLEPASANFCANPRFEGAAAGTPGTAPTGWSGFTSSGGGLTRQIVGTGDEDGIPYIDVRYSGTNSSGSTAFITLRNMTTTEVAAAQNQTWTYSHFVRLVAGGLSGLTFRTLVSERDAGGAVIGNTGSTTAPTSAALRTQRMAATRTLSSASAAAVVGSLQVDVPNAAAIDFTIRLGAPQLEMLGWASTPILPDAGSPASASRARETHTYSPYPRATDRPSSAWYFNAAGTMLEAPANTERLAHDPATLAYLGPLQEAAATNGVRNPRAEGAVAGAPGTLPTNWGSGLVSGITQTVVGAGTEDGIPYLDVRFNGTPGASGNMNLQFEAITGIAAAAGEVIVGSVFWRLVGGAMTNVTGPGLLLQPYDAVPAALTASINAPAAPTSAALRTQRISTVYTMPANTASVRPALRFTLTNGSAIDFTIRVGAPQVERDTLTTPILPPASVPGASTRAAETISLPYVCDRDGKAWAFNSALVLTEYQADVPRPAYDPETGAYLGVLAEAAATNWIENTRWIGAAAGTPGTSPTGWSAFSGTANSVTRTIVGTGVEDGLPYVEVRYAGTPSASGAVTWVCNSTTEVAAAAGQSWTQSGYFRLVAGSAANATFLHGVAEYDAGGALLAQSTSSFAPTSAPLRTQRRSHTRALSNGAAAWARGYFQATYTSGQAVDFTLRHAAPQFEMAASPTTPILGDAGDAANPKARAAEAVTSVAVDAIGGVDGTAAADITVLGRQGAAPFFSVMSADGQDAMRFRLPSAGTIDTQRVLAGSATHDSADTALAVGTAYRAVIAYGATGADAAAGTGAGAVAAGTSGMDPLGLLVLDGGPQASGAAVAFRRLRAYRRRLTAGQAAALAAVGSTLDASGLVLDTGDVPAGVVAEVGQSLIVADAEVTGRHCRVDISDPGNPDGFLSVALAYAGPVWELGIGMGPESHYDPDRMTQAAQTRGGQVHTQYLWRRRAWRVAMDFIEAAEAYEEALALDRAATRGVNVLFCPDHESAYASHDAVFGVAASEAPLAFPFDTLEYRKWTLRVTERL